MSEKIIIYLQFPDVTQASFVCVNTDNEITHSVYRESLSTIKNYAKNSEVIVIVPAQDVLLTHAALPKLNTHRLQQALPFALEENLIDDVETLHFATGAHQENNTWPVAIVAKQKMDEWLNALQQVDLAASYLIPAPLALQQEMNHWYIVMTDDEAIVRINQWDGFCCNKINLATLLDLKMNEVKNKPHAIYLNFYTSDRNFHFTYENIPVQTQHYAPEQFINDLATWLDENSAINLLQGPYRAKQKTSDVKKTWTIAAYLALAVIATGFIGNLIGFFILYFQAHALERSVHAIYKNNFPSATSIVAPKERMSEKLKKLMNQSGKNSFLATLALVGKSFAETPGIHLLKLDFKNQQVTLELSTATSDNLDKFTNSLNAQGLSVKQQNAAISGAQVKATLLIQRGPIV